MYCPQCSQQQVSEETKFCSRCGFPLALVSDVLAHGGFLPQLAELHKSKRRLTRKNGMFFSLMWAIFFVLIMTPFWAILDVDPLAGMSAIIGLFGGLMWLLASIFFLKKEEKTYFQPQQIPNASPNAFYDTNQRNLPSQQARPAQSYVPPANSWRTPDTGDFARPSSVVEGTTKLLRRDDE